MKEIIELLNKQLPETKPNVQAEVRKDLLKRINEKMVLGWMTHEIPEVIFVCPYSNLSLVPENRTCTYHFTTGQIPSRTDCYICRNKK